MRRGGCRSFIPPYILRAIAERGETAVREFARATIDESGRLRGGRLTDAVPVRRGRSRVRVDGARRNDSSAAEASDAATKAVTFFRRILGSPMRVDLTLHHGRRFCNALWDGQRIFCGDGDDWYFRRFISLDVIAHEMGHALVQQTAGLESSGESGALAEHFCDVFAVLARQYTRHENVQQADWLVGADLLTDRVAGAAIRSMRAPGTAYDDPVLGHDPQPAHIRDYVRAAEGDTAHVNCGIPSRAFYEIAALIGGNAWEVAGPIWYRALTRQLRPRSTFAQCAEATWRVAGQMYGLGSTAQQAVAAAWASVGLAIGMAPRLGVKAPDAYQPPAGAAEIPMGVLPLRPTRH